MSCNRCKLERARNVYLRYLEAKKKEAEKAAELKQKVNEQKGEELAKSVEVVEPPKKKNKKKNIVNDFVIESEPNVDIQQKSIQEEESSAESALVESQNEIN